MLFQPFRKNLKSSLQEILDSVEGNLTHEQNSKMKVCLSHYDNILDCINQIEQAILPLIQPFQNEINLILTVPSMKDISAITILSEIGADMSVFKDAEHLCSWASLTFMEFFLYYFSTLHLLECVCENLCCTISILKIRSFYINFSNS